MTMSTEGTAREQAAGSARRKKREPNGGSFKKGDPRINREGKSKQLAELEQEFRQAIVDELYRVDEYDADGRRTNFEALARRWVQLGKAGNLAAIEGLAERILGKPVQPVSGAGGGPVEFKVIIEEIGK